MVPECPLRTEAGRYVHIPEELEGNVKPGGPELRDDIIAQGLLALTIEKAAGGSADQHRRRPR